MIKMRKSALVSAIAIVSSTALAFGNDSSDDSSEEGGVVVSTDAIFAAHAKAFNADGWWCLDAEQVRLVSTLSKREERVLPRIFELVEDASLNERARRGWIAVFSRLDRVSDKDISRTIRAKLSEEAWRNVSFIKRGLEVRLLGNWQLC